MFAPSATAAACDPSGDATLKIETSQAKLFLSLLDDSAAKFIFLAYPESEDCFSRRAYDQSGSIHDSRLVDSLTGFNQAGFAIAVAVNETDGEGRRSENIERIRAVWQEDDGGYSGLFPLEPSVVVETSPGKYHRYWLIADQWPFNDEGRRAFNSVMASMIENYGSDPSAKDASRVLRLPGSYHRKGKPFQTSILQASGKRYSKEDILLAFAPQYDASQTDRESRTAHEARAVAERSEEEESRILDALRVIPADDRETWLRVGMALHHHYASNEGLEIWLDWSGTCPEKFDLKELLRQWQRFRDHDNPVTEVVPVLRQAVKVDSPMKRMIHHEDAQTVHGRVQGEGCA